ncbi:MAG: hypothetical protein MI976_03385 [Pseudomonadales bacterium]|nr:hypothetical protein [Pseudomonadales bacterium]
MKLFVKFLMFLVVLALAGPFIMRGPDGKPLMSLQDLSLPDFSLPSGIPKGAPKQLTGNDEEAWIAWSKDKPNPSSPKVYVIDPQNKQPIQAKPGVFYRWKDAEGVWQFSSTPNLNTPNIVIETDPNANIVQSLSDDKIDSALGRVKEVIADVDMPEGDGPELPSIPLPTTVPISEVPELINQAKAVQDLMNKRTELLNNNQF